MLRFTFHRSPLISRSPLEQRNHARRNQPRTRRIPTVLWRGTSSAAQAIDQRPLLRACGTDREWRRTQRRQARQRVRGRIDRAESAAAQSLRNRSAVISGGPLNHADGRPCSGNDLVGDISGKRIGRVRVQVRPDRVRCHAPSGQTGHVQHLSIRNGIPLTHSAAALPQLQRHGNDPADVARCLRDDLFIHGDKFSPAQPYMSTPPKPAVCAAIYHCSMNIGARLRKLRKHYGLTGEDLAEIFGVTKSRISQIESGDGVPSIDQIIKLRRKVEFSSDWLVFGSGRAPWRAHG